MRLEFDVADNGLAHNCSGILLLFWQAYTSKYHIWWSTSEQVRELFVDVVDNVSGVYTVLLSPFPFLVLWTSFSSLIGAFCSWCWNDGAGSTCIYHLIVTNQSRWLYLLRVELGSLGKYGSLFGWCSALHEFSSLLAFFALWLIFIFFGFRYKAWGSLLAQQLVERDIIVACIDYRCDLKESCLVSVKCYAFSLSVNADDVSSCCGNFLL
jgi:hypothetical protein